MEISSIKAGLEPSDAAAMVVQLSEQQRDELELLYAQCPRPTSAHLHDFIKDRPTLAPLDKHCLKTWFHNRRLKEKRDEHLSPLIHKNAELQAEQQSLLLRNSQLRSQTLLLNLENQRLKEQLEMQLQKRQSAASSSASSLAIEGISSDSDIEEPLACGLETGLSKVKLGWD